MKSNKNWIRFYGSNQKWIFLFRALLWRYLIERGGTRLRKRFTPSNDRSLLKRLFRFQWSNTVMFGRPWGLYFRENCGLAYWIWSVFLRCFDNKYILLLRKKKIFLWATMASSFTFQILHFTRTQKNKIVIKTRERRDKRILKIVKVERKKHTQAASELGERNDTKMTKEKRG